MLIRDCLKEKTGTVSILDNKDWLVYWGNGSKQTLTQEDQKEQFLTAERPGFVKRYWVYH